MTCGPLFCCFCGTSVDAKKVIDAYSCWNGTHSHNINIIIRLVVPHCLMWTIGVTEPLRHEEISYKDQIYFPAFAIWMLYYDFFWDIYVYDCNSVRGPTF